VAIVYGEASTSAPFEEQAAIANAVVRKRNAYNYSTVNELVNKRPGYIAAVSSKNIRYRLAMCSDVEVEYPDLYDIALNALDPEGIDYANGGCFWDGQDLKTKGTKHKHYLWGYMFSDPLHDVLDVGDTPPMNLSGPNGSYDYTLESTAGYGQTIF
jgi:hypothetical protein